MLVNDDIISLLNILAKQTKLAKQFKVAKNELRISEFIKINNTSLEVSGTDFEEKITIKNSNSDYKMETEKFELFIDKISPDLIRLNHLGISYSCKDIKIELKKIKKNEDLILYEEKSGNKDSRWFFVGDKSNWRNTLFEIVLNQYGEKCISEWIPHFQIDIDTNLDYSKIRSITEDIYGKNFIAWELNIPNLGVVLCMGKIGQVSDTKIYLGIGTNLRNSKYQREHLKRLT